MPRKRGPTLGAAQPCKQCSTKWRRLPGNLASRRPALPMSLLVGCGWPPRRSFNYFSMGCSCASVNLAAAGSLKRPPRPRKIAINHD